MVYMYLNILEEEKKRGEQERENLKQERFFGKEEWEKHIMWNAGLDEAQTGIKIAGRNISNIRYADDTTLMAESEEELKSLMMKLKEESEKVDLKFNI